jgi:hypothetical protein
MSALRKTKLRLVTSNSAQPVKPNPFAPRPIKIHYEGGSMGHCQTIRNAMIAATRHILIGGGKKATIFSDGIMVADVVRSGYTVKVQWRRGTVF